MNCDVSVLTLSSNHCCVQVQLSSFSGWLHEVNFLQACLIFVWQTSTELQVQCSPRCAQLCSIHLCVVVSLFLYPVDISQGTLHCFAGIKIHWRLYLLQHCRTMPGGKWGSPCHGPARLLPTHSDQSLCHAMSPIRGWSIRKTLGRICKTM